MTKSCPRETSSDTFDLSDVRSPHGMRNKVGRVLWAIAWGALFRPSPRIFFGWRRLLLRIFGASLGRKTTISNSVRIWAPWNLRVGDFSSIGNYVDCYCVAPIAIGANCVVSQYTYLCAATHDYKTPRFELRTAPIFIEDGVWIAADVFIGPGVTIGKSAVVGARSSVFSDVAPWTVVAGNPACKIKQRQSE
jgi:putative colanic acid biosynthesis acetyltransferase WcaF